MKSSNKKANMGMAHYLKKFWRANFLAILPVLAVCALQTGTSLVMIQTFQRIIERDLRGFGFWILMMVGAWFLLLGVNSLQEFFQGRAVRSMNNAVRRDMAATLLQKNHREFHELDTGEYLSWFTNDINQIESLAWKPFYQCVDSAAIIVFSAAALLTLHWSLLGAALVTAAVMLFVPQLFNQRMEKLGGICVQEQAAATSKLKDLLAGYDVLRFFGREQRFSQGADMASDQIEKPRFRLTYVKGFVSAGIGCINILCQMLVNVLIGVLSIQGVILQGSLMGGGNLCGSLSNGLGRMAQLLLSISSSKPYFEKITVRAGDAQPPAGSAPDAGAETPPAGNGVMTFSAVQESVTPKDAVNLRTAPTTTDENNIVVKIQNGEALSRTGINNDTGWSRIDYNGQTLYAVSQYLTTDLNYKPPVIPADPNRVVTAGGSVVIFENCDDWITPKEYVNLRTEPSTVQDNDTVSCQLNYGEKAHRTGYSEDFGWARVEYNGQVLYVVTSFVYVVPME